ncbi:hypothetical protein FB567DRAFT_337725 [Paraphoma chrysanthemicola]|uniref:C2H2-type domain-containing protein n=1 Tax=Paraphoma chrysanthemicola TaxID=798071 RepID=A0A8K0RA69_9PLEO|nr:hypothetical protein FB567DRAFT_337725 [Paraphoma chrysanthemicola]
MLQLDDEVTLSGKNNIYTPAICLDNGRVCGPGDSSSSVLSTRCPSAAQADCQFTSEASPDLTKWTFDCNYCSATFNRRCDLNKHIVCAHERRYPCLIRGCPQPPFGLKLDRKRHMGTVHRKNSDSRICCNVLGCVKMFSRRDNMLRHVKKDH